MAGRFREGLRFLASRMGPYRRGIALGCFCLLGKEALGLTVPMLIRDGINALVGGQPILWLAAAIVGLSAAKNGVQYALRVIFVGVSRDFEYDLRNDLFDHLLRLSADFYQRWRVGDIMARATNDLNAVRLMLGPALMNLLDASFSALPALLLMLFVDWRLTLVAFLPAPLLTVTVILFGRAIHRRFEGIQRRFADLSSHVEENLSGVRLVRAYSQETPEAERFRGLNVDYRDRNTQLARLSSPLQPLLQFLAGCSALAVLWVGGLRVMDGKLSLGALVMFQLYLAALSRPLIALGRVINMLQRGMASAGRLRDLQNEPPSVAAPADPLPAPAGGELVFEDARVVFGPVSALRRVSLRIEPGRVIGITGPTGAGKTALVNLIPRLLDPSSGAVLLAGQDLRRHDPKELRRHIAMVPQETFLFGMTLAENIAFGVPTATRAQIGEAALAAGLGPDLEFLTAGLDTLVGERGVMLSGGQKQRVALARALLRDPAILILDDALSAVDTQTEARILAHLRQAMRGRTTIVISHRLSALECADEVVVLEGGRITERGTHQQLLRTGSYYARLRRQEVLQEQFEEAM